jgi:phage N-6-adenine-methyltransferase
MNNKVMFSSGKDDWETPDDLYDSLNSKYGFVLDAAASSDNNKCGVWFGPDSPIGVVDALAEDAPWADYLKKGNIWLNPPYTHKIQKAFIQRVVAECGKFDDPSLDTLGLPRTRGLIVCLLPARTDTKIFHEFVKPFSTSVEFLRGRLKFGNAKHGAPFPSMIVVF